MKDLEITNELRSLTQDLLNNYKKQVTDDGHKASGELQANASYQITYDGRGFEVDFFLKDYWKYLEYGTKPHFPPVDKIEEWIRVKPVVPTSSNGKVPTTRQLAFKIAYSINEKGTKDYHTLEKALDNSEDIINLMVDSIISQMDKQIDEEYENIK